MGCGLNGNKDYMIGAHQKKRNNDFVFSIRNVGGNSFLNEVDKRRAIRRLCLQMFSPLSTKTSAVESLLSKIEPLDSIQYNSLLGNITKDEVECGQSDKYEQNHLFR